MSDRPVRIQRSRAKGWRMPEGAVYVGRPTKWGNPFDFRRSEHCWSALALGCKADGPGRREASVRAFRRWVREGVRTVENGIYAEMPSGERVAIALSPDIVPWPLPPTAHEIRTELRGKTLACWCALGAPCHADVLLEIANGPEPTDYRGAE